ncbi:MAG: GNAT family N-acetyltransferase [Chloroflexi bacterium]|nr:GNAT family N-acetyltransferase [Chloroflexota bacterium]
MDVHGYAIRPATPSDVAVLPDVERAAGLLFKTYPGDLGIPDEMYDSPNSVETFSAACLAGHLWVATASGGEIVGFALVVEIEGYAHLDELNVLPSHGRKGIGSALLTTVCAWAKDVGYSAVTLRTFRDVPWNAPFYRRLGFRIVDSSALSAAHVALEASEQQRGLRTDIRVTMANGQEGV